ncbi:Hsp20/alpha crystallin family protein [Chroococcidiopsis sp. CCMEE 29]|uniref:Hsp20/alpha crystallin family protein n=1 Tax=Chroococcidiopsis sp. CCMEE 29 TaxID=155894 RepID=UPI00201FC687|nr:Hsp20/alpha crystallin family protein [Chroococcidiopsis sp. CCMEE 29]
MALVHWEPFREIESLQREMNRLFERMMLPTERSDVMAAGPAFIPPAEMHEAADRITLKMEVPGIEAKDLDVKVTAEAVAISGERKSEIKSDERGMQRSEFRYGRFQRVIPLPARIQNDKVQAEFKNGVLCLTMPKAEEEKNRVVTINLGGQTHQGQIEPGHQVNGQPATQPQEQNQPA